MRIVITGHRIALAPALKEHVEQVLAKAIGKYFADSLEAHVTFSREGAQVQAHVSVHVGHDIHAEGRGAGGDSQAGFALAAEHVAKQLRRSKRRLREHHRGESGRGEPGRGEFGRAGAGARSGA